MTVFRAAANDQRITGNADLYITARATGNYFNLADALRIGQFYGSGQWYIYRSYVSFDTSAIPDDDTVTAVSLGMRVAKTFGVLGVCYAYQYNWKVATAGTMDAVYDMGTAGATDAEAAVKETPEPNAQPLAAGSWLVFTPLATAWVKKTATTNYAFRCKRDADGSGTVPTGAEYFTFNSGDDSNASYRPYLDVTHGPEGAAAGTTRVSRILAQGVLSENPLNLLCSRMRLRVA